MRYENILPGIFLKRPNRFIAHVELGGKVEICHVKNTGRCRELLLPGATVYVDKSANPNRKTAYDLITVRKGDRLINMDSQAPNQAFVEYLQKGLFLPGIRTIRPEVTYEDSRLDAYVEWAGGRAFIEVKGVTLEEGGIAMFPDAPTLRGIKHLQTLARCMDDGYAAHAVFIVQMAGLSHFTPNDRAHPAFGEALRAAKAAGVQVWAFSCQVAPDSLSVGDPLPIML